MNEGRALSVGEAEQKVRKADVIYRRMGGWLHKKRMAASVCLGTIQNLLSADWSLYLLSSPAVDSLSVYAQDDFTRTPCAVTFFSHQILSSPL